MAAPNMNANELDALAALFLGGANSSEESPMQIMLNEYEQLNQEDCEKIGINCEDRAIYKILHGYGFLFIFFLAIFGNFINLLIYNTDHIKYYIAIRMLCSRLFVNSATLVCMLPGALRIIEVWEYGSNFDFRYWDFYRYQIYLINFFGFCAMWLTVMMTAECYLHVFFPSHSKSLLTKRNLSKSYFIIIAVGAILELMYFNRTIDVVITCDQYIFQIVASEDDFMILLEKVHTIANLILSIILPMSILCFMAFSILWRLVLRRTEFNSHFTSEKRCVTRITLITTGLQLVAELPPIPVFIYAAIFGPEVTNQSILCIWNTIAVFLGLCNISLSFFVYLVFSDKFRELAKKKISGLFNCCCCSSNKSLVHFEDPHQQIDPKITTTLISKELQLPKSSTIESSISTETYLLAERGEDSFL
ncbi:unnamed protein product [Caenorhabditis angaria]|uniref:G-protein coupled receptors family 1 profile domain-containing protein n=1 Tax=Caenorhabditis angaria TaxID=860376 RepID=A0A9P1IPP2_9PELO|nr:unnamed protein product [Caenorhabditis angaria]